MVNKFLAPRQFKIIIYQLSGSLILLFSILMLIATVVSFINWSPKDILIGLLLAVPPFLLGVVILYTSQKCIDRVIIDVRHNVLVIKKKGQADKTLNLRKVNRFVLKELIYPMPGFKKIIVNVESDDGISTTLISDDIVVFGHRWDRFCDKLAKLSEKPMKRESVIENLRGKFSPKRENTGKDEKSA